LRATSVPSVHGMVASVNAIVACRGFLWSADGTRRHSSFVLAGRIQQPFVGHRWAALKCNIAVERARTGGSAVEGDLNLADDAWVCAKSSVPATHPLRIVLRARLGNLGWRQGDATALQKPKS
jgi:hypothetical protein